MIREVIVNLQADCFVHAKEHERARHSYIFGQITLDSELSTGICGEAMLRLSTVGNDGIFTPIVNVIESVPDIDGGPACA